MICLLVRMGIRQRRGILAMKGKGEATQERERAAQGTIEMPAMWKSGQNRCHCEALRHDRALRHHHELARPQWDH